MKRWLPVFALMLVTQPSAAQDTSASFLARGVALRRQGQDAAALREFQRAYELEPSPRAQAQIALAQQALGGWLEAERGLSAALSARDDGWIAHNRPHLEQALHTVQSHLANLWLEVDVNGAELRVAGASAGVSPRTTPVRVIRGEVLVEAAAQGYASLARPVVVEGGTDEHVRLTLVPLPPRAAAPEAPPVPVAAPISTRPAPAPTPTGWTSTAPAPRSDGTTMRTAGALTLVGAGVLLSGSFAAYLVREYHADRYNDTSFCTPMFDCAQYARTAETAQTLAIVGAALGGAALVTGLALVLAAPGSSPAAGHLEAHLTPHAARIAFAADF